MLQFHGNIMNIMQNYKALHMMINFLDNFPMFLGLTLNLGAPLVPFTTPPFLLMVDIILKS